MSSITEDKIQTILSNVLSMRIQVKTLSLQKILKNVSVDDEIVNVELLLKYPAANFHEDLKGIVEEERSF